MEWQGRAQGQPAGGKKEGGRRQDAKMERPTKVKRVDQRPAVECQDAQEETAPE